MTDETRALARRLGTDAGSSMAKEPYYADVDEDALEDVLDDAWMMGATQDTLADAGFAVHDDSALRAAARAAFAEGFRAAFQKPTSVPASPSIEAWTALALAEVPLAAEAAAEFVAADEKTWAEVMGESWGDVVLELEDEGYSDAEDPEGRVREAFVRAVAAAVGRSV